MKKITMFQILGVLFLGMAIIVTGCKKKEDPTTGTITGTATFPAGTSGDLSNAKASLYTGLTEWQNNIPVKYVAVSGSGAAVSFTLNDIVPGTYYLDVWKDIDNTATWTANDFVGWYGSGGLGSITLTPLQVTAGGTFTTNVTMYIYK
jgi:hypothetical protein